MPAPPPGRELAPLEDLARRAQQAQRERVEAYARFESAAGVSDVAQGLFRPEGATVPARPESLGRAVGRTRLRGESAVRDAFERALAETRAAHTDYLAALAAIDAQVFALYDVPPDALQEDDAATPTSAPLCGARPPP